MSRRKKRPGSGYVYFIRAIDGHDLIKIGWTEFPPERRLASLQAGSPFRLEIMAFTHGSRDIEAEFHRRFHHLRVAGEWFKPHPDIIEAIERVGTEGGNRITARHVQLMDNLGGLVMLGHDKEEAA